MHLVTSSLLEWENTPTDKSENSTTRSRAIFLNRYEMVLKAGNSLDWTLTLWKMDQYVVFSVLIGSNSPINSL